MKALHTVFLYIMALVDHFVAFIKEAYGVKRHMSKDSHYGIKLFVAEAKSKISGAKANLNFWLALLQNSPTIA